MADITYNVYIDLNNDGDFSDANEDVSAYVMPPIQWQLGFSNSFDVIARDATASLYLRNTDKRFSPDHASGLSGFTIGRRVKIETVYSAVTRVMSVLWIAPGGIQPAPDERGERRTQVTCYGYFGVTQGLESFIPIQKSKTADQVIPEIVEGGYTFPPGMAQRWLLGVTGWGELGETTTLGAQADYLTAETGKTSFQYVGDQWGSGVSIFGALRDVLYREHGYFFQDRNGLLKFWNRHHFIVDVTSDQTFDNTMSNMKPRKGDMLANRVTVRCKPRKVSASPEILGVINSSIQLAPFEEKEVSFRYTSTESGVKIGGENVITPVANTDWTANTASDGSGSDVTSSITILKRRETANQFVASFVNPLGQTVYVQSGAKVRGTKISDFGETAVVVLDNESIGAHRYADFGYPGVADNLSDAQAFAEFELAIRKDATGQIRSISFGANHNSTLQTAALVRTIGDRVTIIEDQTGLSADYFIISEAHMIAGKRNHTVTWGLAPASNQQFWLLGTAGYSELGETTIVGPL